MTDVLDHINNLACSRDALQVIVFDDDSIEAHFRDGSSLQLSPCGSCFHYVRGDLNPAGISEVNKSTLKQRCCFATSETKLKVEFALFWRNHFAQRPYIPVKFQHLYGEIVHSHKNITSYHWPDNSSYSSINNGNKLMVEINASDNLAKLEMSKNQHVCQVKHLVKLSPNLNSSASLNNDDSSVKNFSNHFENSNCDAETRKYVWVNQIFPVSSPPTRWKYPLFIAQQSMNTNKDASQLLSTSHAPQPIPTVCEKQYSHVWRTNFETNTSELSLPSPENDLANSNHPLKALKLLWSNKTMYWMLTEDSLNKGEHSVGIEVWLPNCSILISAKSPNYYYTHLNFDDANPSAVKSKRVYSASALPMDANLKTVILRAMRLQSYTDQLLTNGNTKTKQHYCWQDDLCGFGNLTIGDSDKVSKSKLEHLHENVDIPNLGRFSAVNSSVQIVYVDGTKLYISLDQSCLNSLQNSNANLSSVGCRILFVNGQYMEVSSVVQYDSHLSVYLKPACDWLLWLAKSKNQQSELPFYCDTIFSREKLAMIDNELEKINRFNFLLEHSHSINSTGSIEESLNKSAVKNNSNNTNSYVQNQSVSCSSFHLNTSSPFEVANVLKDTTRAIDDIDNFIKTFRSSN